jgi:hypothetical protein
VKEGFLRSQRLLKRPMRPRWSMMFEYLLNSWLSIEETLQFFVSPLGRSLYVLEYCFQCLGRARCVVSNFLWTTKETLSTLMQSLLIVASICSILLTTMMLPMASARLPLHRSLDMCRLPCSESTERMIRSMSLRCKFVMLSGKICKRKHLHEVSVHSSILTKPAYT